MTAIASLENPYVAAYSDEFVAHPFRLESASEPTALPDGLLEKYILPPDSAGVVVARFPAKVFSSYYEKALVRAGVDVVILDDPSAHDKELFSQEVGYLDVTEKVSWKLPVTTEEEYLKSISSKERNRYNNKLKKSAHLEVSYEPLTEQNAAEWYEIYKTSIVDRPGGRDAFGENRDTIFKKIDRYSLLTYRDPHTHELLGGAIINKNAKKHSFQISYAAYGDTARPYELGIRTFAEIIRLAEKHHYLSISHGIDTNFFGHRLHPGLAEFKESLKFEPKPYGKNILVKVLSDEKLKDDSFLYSLDSDRADKLHIQNHIKPASEIDAEKIPLSSIPQIVSTCNAEILKSCLKGESKSDSNKIDQIFSEIIFMDDLFTPVKAPYEVLGALYEQTVSAGRFLEELALKVGEISLPSPREELPEIDMSDPALIRRLTAYADHHLRFPCWNAIVRISLRTLFGDCSILGDVPEGSNGKLLGGVLSQILEDYGKETALSFLQEMHKIHDLQPMLDYPAEEVSSLHKPYGIVRKEQLYLEKYVDKENLNEARQLVDEIYSGILNNPHLVPFSYQLNRELSGGFFTNTNGGVALSLILKFIELPINFRAQYLTRYHYTESAPFRGVLVEKAKRLLTIATKSPEEYGSHKKMFDYLVSEFTSSDEIFRFVFNSAGVVVRKEEIEGRNKKDFIAEIYETLTDSDISNIVAIIRSLQNTEERKLAVDAAAKIFAEPRGNDPMIVREVVAPRLDVVSVLNALSQIDSVILDKAFFYKHLRAEYGLPFKLLFDRFGLQPAYEFIADIIEKFGYIPENLLEVAQALRDEAALSKEDQFARLYYLLDHPEHPISEADWNLIDSLEKGLIPFTNFSTAKCCLAIRLLGDEKLGERARNHVIRVLSQGTSYTTDEGKDGEPSALRLTVARWLSPATNDPKNAQLVLDVVFEAAAILKENGSYADAHMFVFMHRILENFGHPASKTLELIHGTLPECSLMAFLNFKNLYKCFRDELDEDERPLLDSDMARDIYYRGFSEFNEESAGILRLYNSFEPAVEIVWRPGHYEIPSEFATTAFLHRVAADRASTAEIRSFIDWHISNAEHPASSHVLNCFAQISNPEITKEVISGYADLLRENAWESTDYFQKLKEAIQPIQNTDGQNLYEKLIGNPDFIQNHPWEKYGYDTKTVEKVRQFSRANDFSPLHAELLLDLLATGGKGKFALLWATHLVQSSGFSQMVKFLQYWGSLPKERKELYLNERMSELLASSRQQILKECRGSTYETVSKLCSEFENDGKEVPSGLKIRLARLEKYRELFLEYETASTENKDEIMSEINTLTLEDYPVRIDPAVEMQVLVFEQTSKFKKLFNLDDSQNTATSFFIDYSTFLQNSGVLPRLVQFSSFADSTGLAMLRNLIDEYSESHEIDRTTVNGRICESLDRPNRFIPLEEVFTEYGVTKNRQEQFFASWKKVLTFHEPNAEGLGIVITHDLGRWLSHGETPRATCQRITSQVGNMFPANWNYQFGPCPNADGRPLARPLLPQLKLIQFYEGTKLVGRSVLEVTVDNRGTSPELSLLVEERYVATKVSDDTLKTMILEYAEKLGISKEHVYFAPIRASEAPIEYPTPLPEKYRLYRDYFRT